MFKHSKKILAAMCAILVGFLVLNNFFKSSAQDDYSLPVDTSYINDLDVKVRRSSFGEPKIYNAKKFETLGEINTYVDDRKRALTQLAEAIPDQEIEVAISPEAKMTLTDFKELENEYGFRLEEISLDLFVNDKWDRMVWIKKDSERISIQQDAKSMMGEITELEFRTGESKEQGKNEFDQIDTAGKTADAFTAFTVRFARAKITASQARRLNAEADILLVDPVTDIASHFRGRVIDMPQLYVVKELMFGSIYRPENITNTSNN